MLTYVASIIIISTITSLTSLVASQTVPLQRQSPAYNYEFQFALPIPPVKQPLTSYTNPRTDVAIDFYEVEMKSFTKTLFPNLSPSSLIGYDGLVPGPTFRITRGRECVIRFINRSARASAIHLHGSYTRAPWDGWAGDVIQPGEFKDYYYPNSQNARTIWYHDHVAMQTAMNVYAGQSGMYIVTDPGEEQRLRLPRGTYDIPLVLNSMFFTAKGDITDESRERTSTYGDTFLVNGQILPHLEVEPRKYRFRVLNSAVSRSWDLGVKDEEEKKKVEMWVVASDAGFLPKPVKTENLIISMAERWEIVINFAAYAGKNLTMMQSNLFADDQYIGSNKIMQFRVGEKAKSTANNGPLPSTLVPPYATSALTPVPRQFRFTRQIGLGWTINGKLFSDSAARLLFSPPAGTVERWTLIGAAGWSHPIHAHLVDFVLLGRSTSNLNNKPGRERLEPYEVGALKDIATLGENESVDLLARYVPWPGVYTFHCHNLIHEDWAMMVGFNVTALEDWGYNKTVTRLEDPVDPRFKARKYTGTDLREVRKKTLPAFAALGAYERPKEMADALEEYWLTKTKAASTTKHENSSTTKPTSSVTTKESTSTTKPTLSTTSTKKPTTSTTSTKKPTPTTTKPTPTTSTKKPTPTTTRTKKHTPTPKPKPRPDARCGALLANAPCDPSGSFGGCCSAAGWFGRSVAHCSKAHGYQSGCIINTRPGDPRPDGRCGKDFGGARCDPKGVFGGCCSVAGWCRRSKAHCRRDMGCQTGCWT